MSLGELELKPDEMGESVGPCPVCEKIRWRFKSCEYCFPKKENQVDLYELKPGYKTNRLVCEAVGCHEEQDERGRYSLIVPGGFNRIDFVVEGDCWGDSPRCSTDLNAAFWAAERVNLFGCHERFLSGRQIWKWSDGKSSCANDPPTIILVLEAETPALVICKAILKLKEQNVRDGE